MEMYECKQVIDIHWHWINSDAFWWIVNYSELWNEDRQFSRTVYVISWTVNTALSTKRSKIVILEHVFVSFQ